MSEEYQSYEPTTVPAETRFACAHGDLLFAAVGDVEPDRDVEPGHLEPGHLYLVGYLEPRDFVARDFEPRDLGSSATSSSGLPPGTRNSSFTARPTAAPISVSKAGGTSSGSRPVRSGTDRSSPRADHPGGYSPWMSATSPDEAEPAPSRSIPRARLAAVLALALAAGFIAWLALRDNGHTQATTATTPAAFAITPQNLRRLAISIRQPIFWLGPKAGYTYELTRGEDGRIYVRYLPAGVAVGSPKPYLTVATYPFPGADAALAKQAAAKGAVTAKLAGKGIAVLDSGHPKSVHVAYPNVNYQVEVYDPTPARAMQLVSAGELASLGSLHSSAGTTVQGVGVPVAASVGDLKALAVRLGHPIYWAGPKAGDTYELTQTSSGKVYIRYLPSGVKVGDPRARYLTVATYPFPGAYAAVAKIATGVARIGLGHGGVAVVDSTYPKSIHLAFPGVSYQVEVFDPSPSTGRRLVVGGAIAPVP
jgi:hypothetical protein